jgi:hypothetical protein
MIRAIIYSQRTDVFTEPHKPTENSARDLRFLSTYFLSFVVGGLLQKMLRLSNSKSGTQNLEILLLGESISRFHSEKANLGTVVGGEIILELSSLERARSQFY